MGPNSPVRKVIRGIRSLVGQKQFYRAARLLMYEATFDVLNDPATNGERYLQSVVLQNRVNPVVFDIGANLGDWSAMLLDRGPAQIHAFEPSSQTFEMLRRRIHHAGARLNRLALSDKSGWATMQINHPGAGSNALVAGGDGERVPVSTVDAYCYEHSISHIDLLKIDAEGYDLLVLRGAEAMFKNHSVEIAQFEYNHRWMQTRSLLRDAFEYLQPLGYHLGKLTGSSVQCYARWTTEMESYREGNYVACLEPWIRRFRRVEDNWTR